MTAGIEPGGGPAAAERELVSDLAELALEHVAPEELAVFAETADEYFHDPRSVLAPNSPEEAVGFGLEFALLTPYVLAAATAVIRFLVSCFEDAVKDEVRSSVTVLVRRVFRRDGDAEASTALSSEQAGQVRTIAYERARALGLDADRAGLLSDAIAGRLVVG